MIKRNYQDLDKYLKENEALVIFGPRRVGKTTLVERYLSKTKYKYKFGVGDNYEIQSIFSEQKLSLIKEYSSGCELIVLDEAQKIPNIGMGLKILVDQVPGIRVIVTGSASFELAGQVGEPLTGRKKTLKLYPLSQGELKEHLGIFDLKQKLPEWLIFGSYPKVVTRSSLEEKRDVLKEIVNSYLLKDVLELERVKSSKILINLLKLLAFQVGSQVSLSELANKLAINYKTVARYIDLLEKSFVLVSLWGFSRNLRNEINKKNKYYFVDNGVRNALIGNFNDLDTRDDVGKLWENFLVSERLKTQEYKKIYANNYFWRTWEGQEVDWVEERDGRLYGFEFKWGDKKVKAPKNWLGSYKEASYEVVNRDNYLNFLE